ncbi:MAG: N-acetyl-gamma-glutamyl-phosphate reductase [Gemmatimonadetes bacterium]|nr:N-acetyl-gamma-glutamyl-phosphate reductase [Gemmatimonadota bacterium]
MISVSIAGASGYAGGELLRLLLGHGDAEVRQITSERFAGRFAQRVHPNLRGRTRLRFSTLADLTECDVLFLCLPHGESSRRIDDFRRLGGRVIDLGADFRLRDPAEYERFYGGPHPRPDLLGSFVYGIAELGRDALVRADLVACAGCNATAAILGLHPLYRAGVADSAVIEVKVGSSEAGNRSTPGSHHPERSGAMRSYKPTGHRHLAEIRAALGGDIHFSATSVEMVRGVLATCHVFVNRDLDDKALWRIYRSAYAGEPFVRLVKERSGIHRYPDPHLLGGSNYCDVGFERDPLANRVVVMSAIDNLMKGAAGQAVQAFNVMHGLPETRGLEFPGLHPA